jgi:hypothetical protein
VTWIRETCISIALAIVLGGTPLSVRAQAGPPLLCSDPGTACDGNRDINLAIAPTIAHDSGAFHAPQFDFNIGLGARSKLTYKIPYVVTNGALASPQGSQ